MVPANGFREDVIAGLSLPQKALPPKYFYDARGSRLFEAICRLRGHQGNGEAPPGHHALQLPQSGYH